MNNKSVHQNRSAGFTLVELMVVLFVLLVLMSILIPAIAGVRKRGYEVKVGTFPFSAIDKAQILGAREGMVKIVAEKKYAEFLGIHLGGPDVTDLVA